MLKDYIVQARFEPKGRLVEIGIFTAKTAANAIIQAAKLDAKHGDPDTDACEFIATETTKPPVKPALKDQTGQGNNMIKHIVDDREWNVRIIQRGEGHGLNDVLIHDKDDPLIEFYDATHAGPKFGPLGQFVSSYYISTFMEISGNGLCLYGGITEWQINADSVQLIQQWIENVL